MNVLGFDTSTAATAVCLLRGDGEAFEIVPDPAALGRPPGHARELMPGVARVLREVGLGFEAVDAIAVGRGPGTFTGLRIGIATARALAAAHDRPLHAVSSLAALAAGIDAGLAGPDGHSVTDGSQAPPAGPATSDDAGRPAPAARPALSLIDARRGEVFAALYQGGQELWAPFAAAPEALVERLRTALLRPRASGDGAIRFREPLEAAGVEVPPEGSPLHVVRALNVCRLARRTPPTPPEAVLPDYLRLPDAQPQR